ncbi:MAG: ACP phosphodiesterase [bacterium]|nr:ACP phosphodiesterase [bacterium]
MNYLAHALLSKNNTDHLVGNFIADHIRGNDFSNYSPGIIEGILMHRRIDTFTDAHPEFKKSKRVFYEGFEKHSGILVDIYFDHLLAKRFQDFHHESLEEFSSKVYEVYSNHKSLLPAHSSRFLEYVMKNNIYGAYSQKEGIERVLFHLSNRINHNVRLDESVKIFEARETELQANFNVFFKEAIIAFSL